MFGKCAGVVILITLLGLVGGAGTIASADGDEGTNAGPADSPWPMWGHDAQHTFTSPYCGPDTPSLKWKRHIEPIGAPWPPAIAADGTIYARWGRFCLHAISPTGSDKWSFCAERPIKYPPAVGADGTIYVVIDHGELYALNPNGTRKWRYDPGRFTLDTAPTLGPDGTIYVASWNGVLHALSTAGTEKWSFAAGDGPPV